MTREQAEQIVESILVAVKCDCRMYTAEKSGDDVKIREYPDGGLLEKYRGRAVDTILAVFPE